jgi:hypothetical protein
MNMEHGWNDAHTHTQKKIFTSTFPILRRTSSDSMIFLFRSDAGRRPLSEPVRRFSSCSTDFSQQIAQVVLFLFLYVFLF